MAAHWIVFGGELKDVERPIYGWPKVEHFRDPAAIEFVGDFPTQAEARAAWKARAQQTVDNALMRFFVEIVPDKCFEPDEYRPAGLDWLLGFMRVWGRPVAFNLDPLDF